MTLSAFIRTHMEAILQEWEDFAATLSPLEGADKVELRDHAAQLLKVIALDLETHQFEQQSIDKSQGHGPQASQDTAAEIHAAHRVSSGFTGEQVMAEFRALRSSVLRLWARNRALTSIAEIEDMVRFNEALDQAQSESMARYTHMLREAQNLFLAILGHDVRTPLGAISMGAQVLLHDPALPAKALKVGVRILNSARRMDEIIRDLLDFSTTHLGDGIPVDPHNVDLGELCAIVVEEARAYHPDRELILTTEGALTGCWDSARMAQACSNLISNAIEHGRPDSPVRVSIDGTAEELVFQVQNEADVIPAAKLRTFFDPVKRFAIRSAQERGEAGTANLGLGLYVVKEIVKAHQGSIVVSSGEDTGVTFAVRLPRRTPHRRDGD